MNDLFFVYIILSTERQVAVKGFNLRVQDDECDIFLVLIAWSGELDEARLVQKPG